MTDSAHPTLGPTGGYNDLRGVEHRSVYHTDAVVITGAEYMATRTLEEIVRHADMPAGESWEAAYVEVTSMARDCLAAPGSSAP